MRKEQKHKRKRILGVSAKQAEINKAYFKMLGEKEKTPCEGCGQHNYLSPSHVISRQDCKNIGKPELIYDPRNVRWLCLSIGKIGCHDRWHEKDRNNLPFYEEDIEYIKSVAPELLRKYEVDLRIK